MDEPVRFLIKFMRDALCGEDCPNQLRDVYDALTVALDAGSTVFIIGNGGSGSNASHFCEDLSQCTISRENRNKENFRRLRVISLTDNTPCILALGNDEGFSSVFVEQLKNLARPNDVLIAISGSGNSPNILNAVEWALSHEMVTVGCTGFDGGKLRQTAQLSLHIDCHHMGMVESAHLLMFHWIVDEMRARMNA